MHGLAPILIRSVNAGPPPRMSPDSTDLGEFGIYSFLGRGVKKLPILKTGNTDEQIRQPSQRIKSIYIFELFASISALFELRQGLMGRKLRHGLLGRSSTWRPY